MKALLAMAFAAATAAPVYAECPYPQAPTKIPDGATATLQEMVDGQKAVGAYQKAINDYTACIDKELDDQLAKTKHLASDAFSYGDIPAGIMVRRYRDLVPERPEFKNVERWYAAIAARPAFDEHVTKIALV